MTEHDIIIDALAASLKTIGLPVEIDRVHDIGARDCPLIIVNSGDIETLEFEGRHAVDWDRLWQIDPSIEIHLKIPGSANQRAETSRVWNEFLSAFDKSPVHGMLAHGYAPNVKREIVRSDDRSIVCLNIELTLIFER